MSNEGISKPDSRQSSIQLPKISKNTWTGHKNEHVSLGQLMQRMPPLDEIYKTMEYKILKFINSYFKHL